MELRIYHRDHQYIQGKVSFKLLSRDVYSGEILHQQLYKETTPEYHLDFFGRKDLKDKLPEVFIVEELERKLKEMFFTVKKQIEHKTIFDDQDRKEYPLEVIDFE